MEKVQGTPQKSLLKSFPRTYWVVIVMEFFERSAFFGMMAFLADYFKENVGSAEQWGVMRTVLYCFLYIIPIVSGAVAEKVGYKRVLGVAFVVMTVAYFGLGHTTAYAPFFFFMVVLSLGGGMFKPIISGTVARSTDERTSTLGFGIYYWTINVGSLIASLVTAHFVDVKNFFPIFMLSAAYVGLMFINNALFYKEPAKPGTIKTLGDSWNGIKTVFMNWRFILLLIIFSGFWGMYDRSTDSAQWLLRENYIDMTPVNDFVTRILAFFGSEKAFEFNVAHIMTVNAGVIVLFQVLVSRIVMNTRPLPTMIVGIGLASLFPLMIAVSNDPWVFILGLVVFSIGEITAYPKLISYVGLIAPRDKVAIYMGFVFLPVCFASLIFNIPNGIAWEELVEERSLISTYWYIVAGVGILTMAGLFAYHKLVGKKLVLSEKKES